MSEAMYGPEGRMKAYPPGIRKARRGDDVHNALGRRVDDVSGRRLGTLDAVLVSRFDARNRFLLVRDRAGHARAVPTDGVVIGGGRVWTPYSKAQVERAPMMPPHGIVGPRVVRELCAIFGIPDSSDPSGTGWERRATLARATRDPTRPDLIIWWPGPRLTSDMGPGQPREPREDAVQQPRPPLPGGLPDRRLTVSR